MISTSDPDDRVGALATFFTAGYTGVSLPVVGVGLVLQHLSPQVTLLVFALAAGLGILAAAPVLVRPIEQPAARPATDEDPMMPLCRCFGVDTEGISGKPSNQPEYGAPTTVLRRSADDHAA